MPQQFDLAVIGTGTAARDRHANTFRRVERVLGAHLVGPNADEVINLFALAIRHELTVRALKRTMFAYPTSASNRLEHRNQQGEDFPVPSSVAKVIFLGFPRHSQIYLFVPSRKPSAEPIEHGCVQKQALKSIQGSTVDPKFTRPSHSDEWLATSADL